MLDNLASDANQHSEIFIADSASLAVADFNKMRQTMDDDRELFDEIVRLFLMDAPPHLKKIKDAVSTNDVDAIRHSAHTLKGMVGIFAAERAMQAADAVEQSSGKGSLTENIEGLELALTELEGAIGSYEWDYL